MTAWKTSLQRGLFSGSIASLLSTLALAIAGDGEDGHALGPTNAISHWIWGQRATRRNDASLKYTALGYIIHHASSTFWAVLFERACGGLLDRREAGTTLGTVAAASAVACFTDYQLTPQRLHPGFEQRLSRPALVGVYAAFGLGLAAGAWLLRAQGAAGRQ